MIKQSDIAMIILVTGISLMASFLVLNSLINTEQARSRDLEKVPVISAEFSQPDEDVFTENSINPTELIRIGTSNPENPFAAPEEDDN